MVQAIEPAWELRDAAFVEDGETAIYRLQVATPTDERECYLKATPSPDRGHGLDAEARLTVIVEEHTDIPVPTVHGAVDEHEALRAPFFLLESMAGRRHSMDALADLSGRHIRSLARQTGGFLGQLHDLSVPSLTRYGTGVSSESSVVLRGERPPANPTELTCPDGDVRWRDRLEGWIEADLSALGETDRFDDLVEPIGDSLEAMVIALPDDQPPVVARVDQGLWNLLTDAVGGEITAMLDWGSLFATPASFDLAVSEYFLAGGPWIGLADVPDHRPAMGEALLEGYRGHRSVPGDYEFQRRCYQLQVCIRSLVSLDQGPRTPRHLPADRVDEAADGMRTVVRELLV